MPISPSELKNFAKYERDAGVDRGAPIGDHPSVIERAEVRGEATEPPYIFTLLRIEAGDAKKRTIPLSLRWFAVAGDGEEITTEKLNQRQGFYRKTTLDLLKGVFGKNPAEWPAEALIPGPKDSEAEIRTVFTVLAGLLKGRGVQVKVTESKNSDFRNMAFSTRADTTVFKL